MFIDLRAILFDESKTYMAPLIFKKNNSDSYLYSSIPIKRPPSGKWIVAA